MYDLAKSHASGIAAFFANNSICHHNVQTEQIFVQPVQATGLAQY
jgi:hypothetical protein